MNRTVLVVSTSIGALAAAAACSDARQSPPTAPTTYNGAVASTASAPALSQVSGAAKPAPSPVGFTKVIEISTSTTTVAVGQFGTATATCPVGATLTGGGYEWTDLPSEATLPFVRTSRAVGNSWSVVVSNAAPNVFASVSFVATAYCAS